MKHYPIDEAIPVLNEAFIKSSAVILHAPPGAGKTTRVPLALMGAFGDDKRKIVMLEPRRIAAVSAAEWMASTLGEKAGETVGYAIRFDRKVSEKTVIEVVTEGILSRMIQSDPSLENVSMVIFDEFHERSIHADLALALCIDIRENLREDLKILVMSATMDCSAVSELLGRAPVVVSEGRSHTVEVCYPAVKKESRPPEKAAEAVRTALARTSGDLLVFLPGAGEIRRCAELLEGLQGVEIRPLYGDLPFEDQEKAIMPSGKRKVVLATNIAETSITIEGIGVVIDCGLTRSLRYDPSNGMNRLTTMPESRASAEQRKGRAGRLGPGVCWRLFSASEFHGMAPFSTPEIMSSDLSSLVLECALWGAKKPSALKWLDPPPQAAWNSAAGLLRELGALDDSGKPTGTGKKMAGLPVHPRLAHLMLRAEELGCARLGADLSALLSERDVLRKHSAAGASDEDFCDIAARVEILESFRKGKFTGQADISALASVRRTSDRLLGRLGKTGAEKPAEDREALIAALLIAAYPDRVGKNREDGEGRFILSNGRGVKMPPSSRISRSFYIAAPNVDAGVKSEGTIRLAAAVTEQLIRRECGGRIRTVRHVEWNKREKRISASVEEKLGEIVLSSRPFRPSDEESVPVLCAAVENGLCGISFSPAARQFQGRLKLVKKLFPEEDWPDVSDERLLSHPAHWLATVLHEVRSEEELSKLDVLPALEALLPRHMRKRLDEAAPQSITVPSGGRVSLDYTSGEVPVLAVKLQEMFGLADTPTVASGRVRVLVHLLSPARRPVQITQDLRGFWNNSYREVRKELMGRYPKHPWPDDPLNASPTARTKRKS